MEIEAFLPPAPVQKGGDNTLQRGTRQGRQESVFCEEGLLTPQATRELWEVGPRLPRLPPAVPRGVGGPSSALPGRALHSVHPALTLTPAEDNSILSPVPQQIQPALPSKYNSNSSPTPQFYHFYCFHLAHLSPGLLARCTFPTEQSGSSHLTQSNSGSWLI